VEDKGFKVRFVTSYGKVGYGTIMAPDVDTASREFGKEKCTVHTERCKVAMSSAVTK
jgi:hypothetical protein